MKILFVTVSPITQGPSGLTSDLASARYRAIIPAEQLSRQGHDVHFCFEMEWTRDIVDFDCDTLVVSKSLDRKNEPLASEMKARGVKMVADMCDNVFDDAKYGEHFRALVAMADVVTSSSDAMAGAIQRQTGRDSIVITDPVEGRRGVPRFAPRLPAIKVLWFGNPLSMEGVKERAKELTDLAEIIPVQLTFVTLPWPQLKQVATQLGAVNPSRLAVRFVPWSLEATWDALEECDIVWIPTASGDFHRTKSPNRLIESLWAGRLAAVDAIPSYVPFETFVPVGKRLQDVVFQSLDDTAAVEARIADAQRRIASIHSPYACGLQWASALGEGSRPPLRLNLGCGDRILRGYVNVDFNRRAGPRPDVVCDLRDLAPFAKGSADEILSVNVVERFWRWEVADLLREWISVLKPGGKMAIECANLIGACRAVVENSGENARAEILYGDPAQKDPLKAHRWGYTPESLAALLTEVGLVQVREEPAQIEKGEPTNMRVVGIKP